MIEFRKIALHRAVVGAVGALVLSTTLIGVTVAPVRAAESCLIIPSDTQGPQLVCAHA